MHPQCTPETPEYQPVAAMAYWPQIGAFVTEAVERAEPATAYTGRELYAAATPLTLWTWQTTGLSLDHETVFALHMIERFVAEGMPQYRSASGRNTIRSRLLALSRALIGDPIDPGLLRPLGRSHPSIPYSLRELITLRSWAAAQATNNRRSNAAALLALGIGAGLSGREIVNATFEDIQVDERGVLVHIRGDRKRVIPVLREWESALTERVAAAEGTQSVFRPGRTSSNRNLITDFVSRANGKVTLQARRMRATWLIHHLEAGTALVPFLSAAGLSSPEALDRFLPFVRDAEPQLERSALRNARAPPR